MADADCPVSNIQVRSEKEALDWSLVLASQGIEVSIVEPSVGTPWSLQVAGADASRALDTLRQYRIENRRWAWRQSVPASELTYHVGAWLWLLAVMLVFAIWPGAAHPGAFESRRFLAGEWWRAFSAVGLHADVAHLASNAVAGVVVLGLSMGRMGAAQALLITWLAGAAGNVAGAWIHPHPYTGVGASGMIMGAIGLLAADAVALWRLSRHATRVVLSTLMGGVFLFLILGTDPKSDVIAHAGGFVSGWILGAVAVWLRLESHPRIAFGGIAALAAAVIGSLICAPH